MAEIFRNLCEAEAGQLEILQGNIAFALGCVRAGIHAVDGYPGTPSSEVIDKGLSQVQDLIKVGWSVNEAVAAGIGHGHSIAGKDCVVTMKVPGLFQAADIVSSGALFAQTRGALVYYVATDFTPNSTQHTIDPRYFLKSCFLPIFEPRNHQELHESAEIAVEISRGFQTSVVLLVSGALCHSEGVIHLMKKQKRKAVEMPENLRSFNVLPGLARKNYDAVMANRMPALEEMVESSPLNHWKHGSGKVGVVSCGITDLYLREIESVFNIDLDVLSIGFTNPLPMKLIREFYQSINGPVFVFEEGYRFLEEAMLQAGLKVYGKDPYSKITEWSPGSIAERLECMSGGLINTQSPVRLSQVDEFNLTARQPVNRPPLICAGCPYRLFAHEVALLKKKKQLDLVFGDIGCNTLLYFMNALDTGLAMGASEAERIGYVLSQPEKIGRCISLVGDSTECHSGMDATRNAIYRKVPGVKVILDNSWTGMTGGQPSPTSPVNLAGEKMDFSLTDSLKAHGANVLEVSAYSKQDIRSALRTALSEAQKGKFTTIVVNNGVCIQKLPASKKRVFVKADECKRCNACLICPGIQLDSDGIPFVNNLCSGCGGSEPACVQSCPTNVLRVFEKSDMNRSQKPKNLTQPQNFDVPVVRSDCLPERISLAIRGVGGQGNLFLGTVLSQLVKLSGFGNTNVIKGETHGMAQMGGPVISTFACGKAYSPIPLPGTVDVLIGMERSEILRPGFLELLKPDGTLLLAATKIIPFGLSIDQYPNENQIQSLIQNLRVIEIDAQTAAFESGDTSGRSANAAMLGALSNIEPFSIFPLEHWLLALQKANPQPSVWSANYSAFMAGRALSQQFYKEEQLIN